MYVITFPLKNITAKQADMVPTFMGHGIKKKKITNCDKSSDRSPRIIREIYFTKSSYESLSKEVTLKLRLEKPPHHSVLSYHFCNLGLSPTIITLSLLLSITLHGLLDLHLQIYTSLGVLDGQKGWSHNLI